MTHVVTENCIKCKFTDCVDVCPVDCFKETPYMLVIDPDECIDCGVCIPECPTNSIFHEEDVPNGQEQFIQLNRIMTPEGRSITRSIKPFPDADFWNGVSGKASFLISKELNSKSKSSPSALYVNLMTAPKLSDKDWEDSLNSSDPKARFLAASRQDFVLDSTRLSAGIRDVNEQIRLLYIKLGGNKIQESDVELLLNDSSKSVQLAILNDPEICLTDRQFYDFLECADTDLISATLKKISADRVLQLLNHPSAMVRSCAYRCELAPLTAEQIEEGLKDPSAEVRHAIVERADFSPSPSQFTSLLEDNSDAYWIYWICLKASEECIEKVLKERNPGIIAKLIVNSNLLSSEQKIDALSINDEQLSLTILNDFGRKISKNAVEVGLRSESQNVRLRTVELRGVKKLSVLQISQCLKDPFDKIRSLVACSAPLSKEQIELACRDPSKLVRLAIVQRKDFIPSLKQFKRALKDKCSEVKRGFIDRFQNINETIIPVTHRGITGVLNDLASISTWTKEKYQLQSELLSLIEELGYFRFSVDARDAWVTRFGEHRIIDVPINQRGSLKDMRGKKVHLICIGSGRYSTIYLAAKPIDQLTSSMSVTE